jgi:cysteine desulfurase family protein
MRIYLDNSATSWPKPPEVINAIVSYMSNCGASPGRSGHSMSVEAARMVFEARELIQHLFQVPESDRVIFCHNASQALNMAIFSLAKPGSHVICSGMEHNSVIRPLRYLEKNRAVKLSIIPTDGNGNMDAALIEKSIGPDTSLVVSIHGSNVNGALLPVKKIGTICRKHSIPLLVDAAQTAGIIPIDMKEQNIDILAFTGHKKLYGPTGTGGLCFGKTIEIDSFIHGGTGSRSEDEYHPEFYPDKLEAGTLNTAGIAGLKAGIEFILKAGIDTIRAHVNTLTAYFMNQLHQIEEIQVVSKGDLPVISVTSNIMRPDEFSGTLDRQYGIMTRPGLHCSPLAHKSLGTFPHGTVRFSPGFFNTEEQMIYTIESIKSIFSRKNNVR